MNIIIITITMVDVKCIPEAEAKDLVKDDKEVEDSWNGCSGVEENLKELARIEKEIERKTSKVSAPGGCTSLQGITGKEGGD